MVVLMKQRLSLVRTRPSTSCSQLETAATARTTNNSNTNKLSSWRSLPQRLRTLCERLQNLVRASTSLTWTTTTSKQHLSNRGTHPQPSTAHEESGVGCTFSSHTHMRARTRLRSRLSFSLYMFSFTRRIAPWTHPSSRVAPFLPPQTTTLTTTTTTTTWRWRKLGALPVTMTAAVLAAATTAVRCDNNDNNNDNAKGASGVAALLHAPFESLFAASLHRRDCLLFVSSNGSR